MNRFQNNNLDNGRFPLQIEDVTVNQTATAIKLLGKNVPNYGRLVAENFVWMLENFAGQSAPANPLTGQLWYETDGTPGVGKLRLWNGNQWVVAGGVSTGNVFPSTPQPGQIFYDEANKKMYYWDGAQWRLLNGPFTGTNPPTNPIEGELWWHQDQDKLYGWDEFRQQWVLIGPGAVALGSTPPAPASGQNPGDLWFNTTTGQLNFYDGMTWRGVAQLTIGTTFPSNPKEGYQFWHTGDKKLYQWSAIDNSWVHIGPGSTIRSATPPPNPVGGDIWFDTTIQKGFIYNEVAMAWQTLGGTAFGINPPASPNPGDLWYDEDEDSLKVWNGTAWVATSSAPTVQPNPAQIGDFWYDVSDGALKFWDGTNWAFIAGDTTGTNPTTGTKTISVNHSMGTNDVIATFVEGQLLGVWAATQMTGITSPSSVVAAFPSGLEVGLNLNQTNGAILNGFSLANVYQ